MKQHNSSLTTAYDLIADIYDEDMGRNCSDRDAAFYVRECTGLAGPILELGCGTGRITLPLAQAGVSVAGIDRSLPMLQVLKTKADKVTATCRRRIRWICMDMRELAFNVRFAAIICPYSAFTYLVSESDRARALSGIRHHLSDRGLFMLDIFIPDPTVTALPDDHLIFDYQRRLPDGTVLTRTKTIEKDIRPGVNRIHRHYQFSTSGGRVLREMDTMETFRYYFPDQILQLLTHQKYQPMKTIWNFKTSVRADQPKTMTIICQKR